MPGESGVTVVTTLAWLFFSARRAAAHRAPGIPCALSFEGQRFWQTSREKHAARSRSCV
jgi:hypothetical protein